MLLQFSEHMRVQLFSGFQYESVFIELGHMVWIGVLLMEMAEIPVGILGFIHDLLKKEIQFQLWGMVREDHVHDFFRCGMGNDVIHFVIIRFEIFSGFLEFLIRWNLFFPPGNAFLSKEFVHAVASTHGEEGAVFYGEDLTSHEMDDVFSDPMNFPAMPHFNWITV